MFATIVTVAVIAGMVILAALGKPVTVLTEVFTAAALPAIGVYLGTINTKVEQTNQQTNGNTSRMLDMLDAQSKMLARMQPPPPDEEET